MTNFSILELYRQEVEVQIATLTRELLSVEKAPGPEHLETMMRAAHSLKGAARLTGIEAVVQVAHAMEDVFVGAQSGQVVLAPELVDVLLACVDFVVESSRIPQESRIGDWVEENSERSARLVASLPGTADESNAEAVPAGPVVRLGEPSAAVPPAPATVPPVEPAVSERSDDCLRLPTESLRAVVETVGEVRVALSWMDEFRRDLLRLRIEHRNLARQWGAGPEATRISEILMRLREEFEEHSLRLDRISRRLQDQALSCQMLPLSEGTRAFPRMVRDLGRQLGKDVVLEIHAGETMVDRSILRGLEAPLTHLLRNAVDHGVETPDVRLASGKPRRATIRLVGRHHRGLLSIVVEDDGRGIDPEAIRSAVLGRGLVNEQMARELTERELIDFLFLPRFTTAETVTEVSGRGVGLDAVHSAIVEFGGRIEVALRPGQGARFELLLPLSLSVIRGLLVEVSGEAYALPLTRVEQVLKVSREAIEELEGRQFVRTENGLVGLISAHQILELAPSPTPGDQVPIVLLGGSERRHGMAVDRLLGRCELVVQTLDPVLGKIPDVATGAVLNDGSPVLILDPADLLHSIEKLAAHGRLSRVGEGRAASEARSRKRVLVADDSITVREVERKLLQSHGYAVDVAVDGIDGWNALQRRRYDLLVTDVDMPRMDGFRLAKMVRDSSELKALPIIIVSYKDREQDCLRGLEAGADRYLTKGSFHDRTLLEAVMDLIGAPDA
ncbi:MAG: hybrid sensor histidine kinase/response regulator [Armatimonadetes bacterium]|nr:hybrid sensor histidine kinase/response regulator [Armatimonadota bacterium]